MSCCYPTAPNAATLNSPVNGYQSSVQDVVLSWTAPLSWGEDCSNNANYKYQVWVGTAPGALNLIATLASSKTTQGFTGSVGTTYYWKIVTDNAQIQTSSATWSFKINAGIQGTVYYDPNNTCSTATPWNKGAGMVVKLGTNSPYSGTVTSGGATAGEFNVLAPGASYGKMTLTNIPAGYGCSTACGQCPLKTNVTSPSQGNNYFLSDTNPAWWQAAGASVYAGSPDGGTTIRSQLTNSLTRLIKPGANGTTEGALIHASGNVDISQGKISDSGWTAVSTYKGKTADYDYFATNMGVIKGQASDFVSDQLALPSYDASKNFYYDKPVSGAATMSGPWHVLSGQKYVIFVNGNFNPNFDITVDQGGFLAVIVSGDINVDAGRSVLEGLYVASGNFTTLSNYVPNVTNDIQLHVNGSVVAWGSVNLRRDLGGVNDDQLAAETFTYRPDLLINMPEKMKVFAMQWQELPAGSFGN